MVKSASTAANVIDLEAFRQRVSARRAEMPAAVGPGALASFAGGQSPMMVPVWFCWVPVWTPLFG